MSALATHSTFVAKVQALAGRKVLRLKTSHHTSGDLLPKKGQVRSPLSSLLTIYFGPKVKTLRSQRVASPLVHRHLFGNQTQPTIDSKSPRHHEGFFWVHRHLPERYYSEPNGAAILLGRVDLRVDHGYFGNHMTIIRDVPRANNPVGRFRSGSGRHGGRPSQEQKAIQRSQHRSMPAPRIDDETFFVGQLAMITLIYALT